jgi:DNA processing protein
MHKDLPYYIALSEAPGIGPNRFKILTEHFKKAEKVWKAQDRILKEILGDKVFEEFNNFRQSVDPDKRLGELGAKNIKITTLLDKDYPERLREISVPPPVLYYRGNFKQADALSLAVVGSRKITSYGRQVTEILVDQLAKASLTIVSGFARGVDSLAHKAALEAGGRTIAVFGCGLDVVYPPENAALAARIIKNGAVVSEFPLGTQPTPGNFPARNRIISGLSLGVLVTEADQNSGSLITAGLALEQNREVFAVPGPIYSRLSDGPSLLIKQGAKLVSNASDVLEELNLDLKVKSWATKKITADSEEEKKILQILENSQKHVDQIIRETGLSSVKLVSLLTTMEIEGKIKNLGAGNYALSR